MAATKLDSFGADTELGDWFVAGLLQVQADVPHSVERASFQEMSLLLEPKLPGVRCKTAAGIAFCGGGGGVTPCAGHMGGPCVQHRVPLKRILPGTQQKAYPLSGQGSMCDPPQVLST